MKDKGKDIVLVSETSRQEMPEPPVTDAFTEPDHLCGQCGNNRVSIPGGVCHECREGDQ